MARKDINYVDIPARLVRALGEPDAETRLYRQIGRDSEHEAWWDAVSQICGDQGAVSPGGASMFGPMSRSGVYKRIKEGRLTGFVFHQAPPGKRWRIRDLFSPDGPGSYMYVPVVELRSWAGLLQEWGRGIPGEPLDAGFLRLKRGQMREYLKKRDSKG